jgi:glycosyltransferase involved in cell wall biosynthesis
LRKGERLRASVCIATHKRPDGLERLLTSLTQQTGAPPFEVVVVDNDVGRSAEPVARSFTDSLRLTYLVEPLRGLARVRNRAVAGSNGDFLAFIDDDEWATPHWLAELDARATERNADVVVGSVTVLFDKEVPEHVRSCSLFQRNNVADGEPVPWKFTHTSNAYVRRSALPDQSSPFSLKFDLTGGEDVELFARMIAGGASVIAASRAEVFEHRALRRANMFWLLRRSMRNGNNSVEIEWSRLSGARRLRLGLGAGYRSISEGVIGLRAWRRDRAAATMHFINMAERLGRITGLLGIRVQEYRKHP